MSLEGEERRDGDSTAERLAELTGKPVEEFEYEGDVPDIDDLETERLDE